MRPLGCTLRMTPAVYMRIARCGLYSSKCLHPETSTYRLSWKSWCKPDEEPGQAQFICEHMQVCRMAEELKSTFRYVMHVRPRMQKRSFSSLHERPQAADCMATGHASLSHCCTDPVAVPHDYVHAPEGEWPIHMLICWGIRLPMMEGCKGKSSCSSEIGGANSSG